MNEYAKRGDYHRKANSTWAYEPIYQLKIEYIEDFFQRNPAYRKGKILDAGCGEGVLVDKYKSRGYAITGIDLNYKSKTVQQADITNLPFKNSSFDVVLCLSVLEHLDYIAQRKALAEIHRVLKSKGIVLFALPNLAHLVSRLSFLIRGKPIRTSIPERHLGDRSLFEWKRLLKEEKFIIKNADGIFPTFPLVSWLRMYHPELLTWLPELVSKIPTPADWCFEVMVTAWKK